MTYSIRTAEVLRDMLKSAVARNAEGETAADSLDLFCEEELESLDQNNSYYGLNANESELVRAAIAYRDEIVATSAH